MIRHIAFSLACILGMVMMVPALVPTHAIAADIALVIGNSKYQKAPNAESAEVDAREVAAALKDGGYDVTLGINMDRPNMRKQILRFAGQIDNADNVVIYYSGHALRSDGISYLTPIDQRNSTLVQVMMDGVPLDLILRMARSSRRGAVVFIDAAQYDGFSPNAISEPGLASINAGNNVLVVSAAAPGQAIRRRDSRGSAFARDVVNEFLQAGTRAMDAARKMNAPAWTTGSVRPGMRLVTRRGARTGAGAEFGGNSTSTNPATVEADLGLSYAQRRNIQEGLSLLGHDTRGIDGAFGPGTRTAIRLWQRANNLTETGYLDSEQVALLNSQTRVRSSPQPSGDTRDDVLWARTGGLRTADGYRAYLERRSDGSHADDARDALKRMASAGTDREARREMLDWRDVELSDRANDYRGYLNRYPAGIWKPEAKERLADLTQSTPPSSADPVAEEASLALTRNDRLSIEQRLNYLGYPPGAQDGFFDSSARRAIEGYQRSRGFRPTGYMDNQTIARLLDETEGVTQGIIIDGASVLRSILGGLQ